MNEYPSLIKNFMFVKQYRKVDFDLMDKFINIWSSIWYGNELGRTVAQGNN